MPVGRLPSRSTLARVLVGLGLLVVLVLFLVKDPQTLRVESDIPAGDPRFPRYAAAVTSGALTSGNRYDILVNGVEIVPAKLEAIRGAQRRISFETYFFGSGRMAEEFTVALVDAARRGVEVRVIVDTVGAKMMDREHVRRMRDAGVDLIYYNPPHWFRRLNYRTHRKILVIDGEVGFTGGAGVGDQWYGDADGENRWRETHLRVVGPAVTELEGVFYENWADMGRVTRPLLDFIADPDVPDASSIVVRSSPTGGTNAIKLLYLLSIAAATRTIDITSPYVVLDSSTRHAILEAARRGVRVRLLVEGETTDALPVKFAGRRDYDLLLAAGVRIYEYQPTMMHVKVTVIDEGWSILGSTNFGNRGFELNDEVNVAIASAGIAGRLTADFEHDLTRSQELTLDKWRARPAAHKVRERFWSLFSELF